MARISKPGKAQNGAKRNLGYMVPVPGTQKKLTDKQKDSVIKSWGITPKKTSKAQAGKKVRLKEDSRDYITKIKTDDEGNVASLKSRRTVKGLLTGAPRAKKIMKNGGKSPARKIKKAQVGKKK
jgi:hypothetical protein